MAKKEHLEVLAKGVAAWNRWRTENPEIQPDLVEADLVEAHLRNAVFGATLSTERLSHYLIKQRRMEASLKILGKYKLDKIFAHTSIRHLFAANFYHADLTGADLSGADLRFADLTWAHLEGTNLKNAKLQGVRLRFTSFYDTKLRGANFSKATIAWTNFSNTDLSVATGLHTATHTGPSTVGIDTIYRSQGKIPESFLRGAGVSEEFIGYARSLIGKISQFFSCFISYSSRDHEFSERLHTDLQSQGVRCWFAPKDLPIGGEIRSGIEEAIRRHDKLLVVLSKNSVMSPWVEDEVEAALERERLQKQTFLFPIRLDDDVMMTKQAWAAKIRRTRNIGDFRMWKNPNRYGNALKRLLRDLQTIDANPATVQQPSSTNLSGAEAVVLRGIIEGWPDKEMACVARISIRTVNRIRQQLSRKIGVRARISSSDL